MAIDSKPADLRTVKLVVGLGNPGPEYDRTYHSAGRAAVAHFVGDTAWRTGRDFRYAKANGLIFALPETFMNESGRAVRGALRYFKLKPTELLLIHDDSDLPLGEWKVQFGRGSAGHKGVASVATHLKTRDFWRARLGIRPPDETRRLKAGDFVLQKIKTAEAEKLNIVFQEIALTLGLAI